MDAHRVKEIIGWNEIRFGCSTMNRRLFLPLLHTGCRRMQTVYRLARFSVSPRINRIRGIVGTYNEASSRLLSNFCITSPRGKGSFRHRFFAASASPSPPLSTRNTYYLHRGNTRCAHIFVLREFIREKRLPCWKLAFSDFRSV